MSESDNDQNTGSNERYEYCKQCGKNTKRLKCGCCSVCKTENIQGYCRICFDYFFY